MHGQKNIKTLLYVESDRNLVAPVCADSLHTGWSTNGVGIVAGREGMQRVGFVC